jgi:putative phosphoribosyl transferase
VLEVLCDDGIAVCKFFEKTMSTQTKDREVEIRSDGRLIRGILHIPTKVQGVVIFAHGSGSGRFSPRNQYVAGILQQSALATFLIDLLEPEEADDREKVFHIELLAERLKAAADWLRTESQTKNLHLGFFGASTGAGAALVAAARAAETVGAIVSRGGRPDLAGSALADVKAPTLLIVGGNDETVRELNEQALRLLRCPKELVVIPGATHLFPEPGALEKVARLAKNHFQRYLASAKIKE